MAGQQDFRMCPPLFVGFIGGIYLSIVYIEVIYNIKETRSATLNIFRNFYFLFKSFVKVELSYVFTINCSL